MCAIIGLSTIIIFLLVCVPLIKFISDKWYSDRGAKKSWFDRKVEKAQKKYNKQAIKDIKKKIVEAVALGKNCIAYDNLIILDDDTINYFENLGIKIEKIGIYDIIFKW